MAVSKATTSSDFLTESRTAEPAAATDVEKVSKLTDPAAVADVNAPKYVDVKSPTGAVTSVPEGSVQSLLDSGYSKPSSK
jgi:hypothetical protein